MAIGRSSIAQQVSKPGTKKKPKKSKKGKRNGKGN
tara:strand:- start:2324 stop:2428 length:105 start_codon:yes stop_codon:yes gene_type:complete